MESYNLEFATFAESENKIISCTHTRSKSAKMLRDYLLSVNAIKFGMKPKLKHLHIGGERRQKWSIYVKKIYDMKPIVPLVDSVGQGKQNIGITSLIKESLSDTIITNSNYVKFPPLEEAKNQLQQAEINKRNDILAQRQKDKQNRQKIIDMQNEQNIKNYNTLVEEKIKEYQNTVNELSKEEEKRVVDKITYEKCLPKRLDDRGKFVDEKVEITVIYANGYKRNFKAIKRPTEEDKKSCFSCTIPAKPEYAEGCLTGEFNGQYIPQVGNDYMYYFKISPSDIIQKKAKLSYAEAVERFKKENPEPKKIPDAKTETTGSWVVSMSCSSLGVARRTISKPIPQTEQVENALRNIREWTVVHGKTKAAIRRDFISDFGNQLLNHNKYAVLQNHKSCIEVHRLANYERNKVIPKNEEGATIITKSQLKKRRKNIKEIRKKDKIQSTESKKNPIIGPNINFKTLMVMIVNSQLFKEEKIKQENQFTEKAFDIYLEKGFLSKSDCHLSKKHRGALKRILDDLFRSLLSKEN